MPSVASVTRLRFAAGEKRRAVRARENADFAGDRADHVKRAAVETFAAFQNQFADGFLLDVVKGVVDDEVGDFFRAEFFDELRADFVLNRVAGGFAGELAGREQRGHKTVAGERLGFVQEFRRGRC